MATKLYLISRTVRTDIAPDHFVDGVFGVIMALDPAVYATQSARAAQAVGAVNSTKSTAGTEEDLTGANVPAQYNDNYFDTEVLLGDPTGDTLAAANTFVILQDVEYGGVGAATIFSNL